MAEQNFLPIRLVQPSRDFLHEKEFGGVVKAIGFFKTVADFNGKLEVGKRIDLIATIERSTFGRTIELRLRIVEIL